MLVNLWHANSALPFCTIVFTGLSFPRTDIEMAWVQSEIAKHVPATWNYGQIRADLIETPY